MNVQLQGSNLFTGGGSLFQNSGLKSAQEKQQRQAERDSKVAFFEKQKSNLKNIECDSIEEISRKLDMLHSYEDQIAAAKEAYNQSQMQHVMDEAREIGEKIAKAAEKYEPKTPEERREEMLEEALGTDESKGLLTETLEEMAELTEETAEELQDLPENISQEEMQEQLSEEMQEETEAFNRMYKSLDIRV